MAERQCPAPLPPSAPPCAMRVPWGGGGSGRGRDGLLPPDLPLASAKAATTQASPGPTEGCTGCNMFLLSSGCGWGKYYRVAHSTGPVPNNTTEFRLDASGMSASHNEIRVCGGGGVRPPPPPPQETELLSKTLATHYQRTCSPQAHNNAGPTPLPPPAKATAKDRFSGRPSSFRRNLSLWCSRRSAT